MTSFFRPNFNSEYTFGENPRCTVTLHPKQSFELLEESEDTVTLAYKKFVRIVIDKESFKRKWQKTNSKRGLDLGEEVVKLQEAGVSQSDIAKKLNCSVGYVRKYWKQPTNPIDYGMLRSLVAANWTLKEILTELNFQTKGNYTEDDLLKILREMGLIE